MQADRADGCLLHFMFITFSYAPAEEFPGIKIAGWIINHLCSDADHESANISENPGFILSPITTFNYLEVCIRRQIYLRSCSFKKAS